MVHRILSFLVYLLKAKNEHSFHSPFVYDFVTKVLYTDKQYYAFDVIEKLRSDLQNNHSIITFEEIGAKQKGIYQKKIAKIVQQAVLPKKYAQLLFKCILYFKPQSVLELGTNLGLTTAYLASANENTKVISIEGNKHLAKLANEHLGHLKLKNADVIEALFDDKLPTLLEENKFDLIFVDGNHTEAATLRYFEYFKMYAKPNTIIVFDDIYWSKGMTSAWKMIKSDPFVSISIDLYKFGLVFFKQGIEKQDFTIRY